MNWERLISNKRLGMEDIHTVERDDRSVFLRDYDRVIFSAPFRRLQNKTQVFPLPGSVFVHNRLIQTAKVISNAPDCETSIINYWCPINRNIPQALGDRTAVQTD